MKKLLIGLFAITTVTSAYSNCLDVYKKKINQNLSRQIEFEPGLGLIGVLGGATIGFVAGDTIARSTYEETPAQRVSEFEFPRDVDIWNQGVDDNNAQDDRQVRYQVEGALYGLTTAISALAVLNIRNGILDLKANKYIKVLKLVDQANRGSRGSGKYFDKLVKKIQKIDNSNSREEIAYEVKNMFSDDYVTCPAERPLTFKKFKKLVMLKILNR